jgi:CDP-paratose 2-epimerase
MRTLITGGAGFIGTNTADRLLSDGHQVIIVDDLSRRGSESNLRWLRERHGDFPFHKIDVRDYAALSLAFGEHAPLDLVLHFAAQVAVTTSVEDPRTDFEINTLGTLNVLEAVRAMDDDPVVLYTSTNKVYGALTQLQAVEDDLRYRYVDLPLGVTEETPLDFYSPYGCSKGAADQYVRDYHRMYGMRTIVFRNSCIYGTRQFGIEDQGWLAWFVIAAVKGAPITIYGNGKQVRDLLYIDDLVEAMLLAYEKIDKTQGRIYNIGGGAENSVSIWLEVEPILSKLLGKDIPVDYADWRPGDQPIYVSDITRASKDFGWRPKTTVDEGLNRLFNWVREHKYLFS